jgi:hypothetical protein
MFPIICSDDVEEATTFAPAGNQIDSSVIQHIAITIEPSQFPSVGCRLNLSCSGQE